jgi:hypothetical protein
MSLILGFDSAHRFTPGLDPFGQMEDAMTNRRRPPISRETEAELQAVQPAPSSPLAGLIAAYYARETTVCDQEEKDELDPSRKDRRFEQSEAVKIAVADWNVATDALLAYQPQSPAELAQMVDFFQEQTENGRHDFRFGEVGLRPLDHLQRLVKQMASVPGRSAWDDAWAEFSAAHADHVVARKAYLAFDPVLPDCPADLKGGTGGGMLDEDDIDALRFVSDDAKAVLKERIAAHWALAEAAEAPELELEEIQAKAGVREMTAITRLEALTPPDPAALADKIRITALTQFSLDLHDAEEVQAALSRATPECDDLDAQIAIIDLYRDACKVAGAASPTSDIVAWDVAAWVEAFEKHPGHYVTQHGRLEFCEFEQPTWVSYERFTITEPDKIALYHELKGTRPRKGLDLSAPFIITDREMFQHLYADAPAKLAVWNELLDQLEAKAWINFPGRALSEGLTDWQREAIRKYAPSRPDRDIVRRIVKDVEEFANSATPEEIDESLSFYGSPERRKGCRPVEVAAARAALIDRSIHPERYIDPDGPGIDVRALAAPAWARAWLRLGGSFSRQGDGLLIGAHYPEGKLLRRLRERLDDTDFAYNVRAWAEAEMAQRKTDFLSGANYESAAR